MSISALFAGPLLILATVSGCRPPTSASPVLDGGTSGAVHSPDARTGPAAAIADAPALLAEIGARFGSGLTPQELLRLTGTKSLTPSSKTWFTLGQGRFGVTVAVEAPSPTAPVSWIRINFAPTQHPTLSELVRVFGPYRKLPPGEHTWVMFETYRRAQVLPSAEVLLEENEPGSRAVMVQFQRPG